MSKTHRQQSSQDLDLEDLVYPTTEAGPVCEPDRGNQSHTEDTLPVTPQEGPQTPLLDAAEQEKDPSLMDYFTPGDATTESLEAIGDWAKEGFDGEEDSTLEQLPRAMASAPLMGLAMLYGRSADFVLTTADLIGEAFD